jgi:hypothetical protein
MEEISCDDALGHCFGFLGFVDLVRIVKAVCKTWRAIARKVLCGDGSQHRFKIVYKRFDSARTAFDAIQASDHMETRLVSNTCDALLRLCESTPPEQLLRTRDPFQILCDIFGNSRVVHGFDMGGPVRIVQVKGCVRSEMCVCVWADVYELETVRLHDFVEFCRERGVIVSAFEYRYPGFGYEGHSGDYVPVSVAMFACGHRELYRGILVGLVFEIR